MSKRYHCEICGRFVDPPYKFISYEYVYSRTQYMVCDTCLEIHKQKFEEFVKSIKQPTPKVGLPETKDINKEIQNKLQNNWNDSYQRWCDENHHRDTRGSDQCDCDFFSRYCDGLVRKGRPCIRALRKYLNENNLNINYINTDFEKIWNRSYWNGL